MGQVVYVTAGNSDDKLTQAQWSHLLMRVTACLEVAIDSGAAGTVHGRWFSAPDVRWQNACWCVEVEFTSEAAMARARRRLAALAAEYRQDSIAWAPATTELIAAST